MLKTVHPSPAAGSTTSSATPPPARPAGLDSGLRLESTCVASPSSPVGSPDGPVPRHLGLAVPYSDVGPMGASGGAEPAATSPVAPTLYVQCGSRYRGGVCLLG